MSRSNTCLNRRVFLVSLFLTAGVPPTVAKDSPEIRPPFRGESEQGALVPATDKYLSIMQVAEGEMMQRDPETVRLPSAYAFAETLEHLRVALESKNFTIFAVIDHRAAAQSVGLDMPPTTVLVFGNPRGGTPLMLAAPDFALELPLRVLVREDEDAHTWIVYNPASSLEGKHDLPSGMAERLAPASKIISESVTAPAAKP